jgi:hypothetical protein
MLLSGLTRSTLHGFLLGNNTISKRNFVDAVSKKSGAIRALLRVPVRTGLTSLSRSIRPRALVVLVSRTKRVVSTSYTEILKGYSKRPLAKMRVGIRVVLVLA